METNRGCKSGQGRQKGGGNLQEFVGGCDIWAPGRSNGSYILEKIVMLAVDRRSAGLEGMED